MTQPRVAWFSPLNTEGASSASHSAHVSDLLLPLLEDQFDIELFHNGFDSYGDLPTYHFLSAFHRHKQKPFDIFFYQLEDHPDSQYLRIASTLMPGVNWFHDLLFSTHGPEPILNSSWSETCQKFINPDREWPDRDRKYTPRGPVGYREAGMCFAALFSSERDHSEYLRQIEDRLISAKGSEQPLSFVLPFPVDIKRCRRLPTKSSTQRIGYCGSPRIEHRAHKLLQAIRSRVQSGRSSHMVWMLEQRDLPAALELISEFGLDGVVELRSGLSPESWLSLLPDIDVAAHLHFSAFGHPGPYLESSLVAGLPVLISRFGSSEFYPEEITYQIEPGDTEALQIEEVLTQLEGEVGGHNRDLTRLYAGERFDSRVIAAELSAVFSNLLTTLRLATKRWEQLEQVALQNMLAVLEEKRSKRLAGLDGLETIWSERQVEIFSDLGWSL